MERQILNKKLSQLMCDASKENFEKVLNKAKERLIKTTVKSYANKE